MAIRNYIMKMFHTNPNIQIELEDLSELNGGDMDAGQEVMEFLDNWGLINFHPFPSTGSAVASTDDNSLLEKLYHFESPQFQPIVQKTSLKTPAMTSGLFPESTVAEEFVKQEGPAVEYHCNSCSADCSRKRYHCPKQILIYVLIASVMGNLALACPLWILYSWPAEVPGVSGEKWTDQETLLLLEALELYKENWNEIAEHDATKSKTQCILHFVQMPIEDYFVDCGDDVDSSCKRSVDAAMTNNNTSVHKDALEFDESKTSNSIEGHLPTLPNETAKADDENKVKVNQETLKPEDVSEKTSESTSKSEDYVKEKLGQEEGNNYALNAPDEAFTSGGYSPGPEGPSSFADVGNPVMALAVFLARLVGFDVAVPSAHSSLKSMSVNSSSTELSARHCFLLEDPPVDKELTRSERDSNREGDQDDKNVKQDKAMLDDNTLLDDHNDQKNKDTALEGKRELASSDDGVLEKPIVLKDQAMVNHKEIAHDNGNDAGNTKLPNDQAPNTACDSDGSIPKDKVSPRSKELRGGTLLKHCCQPIEELKDGNVSDTIPLENKLKRPIKSNLPEEHPQPVDTPKDADVVSDSMPSAKSKPQKLLSTNPVVESLDTKDSAMDVDLVYNSLPLSKNESQPQVTSISSQHSVTEKDSELPHPVESISGTENGHSTVAGEDHTENCTKVKDDGKKAKHDNNYEKLKCAAISTLAAAAVKAKILAAQEEDQIRQLASLFIEKQLYKLETKLAFFHVMENVVTRMREYLVQSKQKLYHERALIIASRLFLPASSSRVVPPNLPINRIPMNFTNSLQRPQIITNLQRPPICTPVVTIATTLPNHLASVAAAGNSVQPSSQESLSSVGTK